MNKLKYPIFYYILFVAFVSGAMILFVQPSKALSGDTLIKIIQGESLRMSGYTSEQLYYEASKIDPEYDFYPFKGVNFLENQKGEFVGQYPVLYSALISVLAKIGSIPVILTLLSWISLIAIFALFTLCDLNQKTHYFAFLGTYLILMVVDLSEMIFFVLLYSISFVSLYRLLQKKSESYLVAIACGFLGGLSVFLRIESLLFVLCFGFVIIISGNYKLLFQKYIFSWLFAFFFCVLLFFCFNYWNYGHVFGSRFLANRGDISFSLGSDKLIQAFILLFAGKMNFGFFGFIPVFFVVIVLSFFTSIYKKLEIRDKLLYASSILFIIGASIVAPNDGVVNWGSRYLVCAIFPFAIVLDRTFKILKKDKIIYYKILKNSAYISMVWSILLILAGVVMLTMASRQNQKFRASYSNMKYDFIVLDSSWMATQVGMDYFSQPVFLLDDFNKFPKFRQLIDKNYPRSNFLYVQSDFPDNPKIEQGKSARLIRKKFDKMYNTVETKSDQLYKLVVYSPN